MVRLFGVCRSCAGIEAGTGERQDRSKGREAFIQKNCTVFIEWYDRFYSLG